MRGDILLVIQELVAQELLEMPAGALQARDAVHHVSCKVKSIQIVQHKEAMKEMLASNFPRRLPLGKSCLLLAAIGAGGFWFA